jgi:sugar/nucleoside kinase (ribokinase family)
MAESGRYAAVIGEALIDLIEERDGRSFRPLPGGSPMNVAVGVARLGCQVEFIGSFGDDGFGRELRSFLRSNEVGLDGSVVREVQTSLAITTFDGPNPSYEFYGSPPSYGFLSIDDVDRSLVKRARVLHAGSIALLQPQVYEAVSGAFEAKTDSVRTLDPNVRGSLTSSVASYRQSLEQLFTRADVVKLSIEDATALYDEPVEMIVDRIASLGPSAVVVTKGPQGAFAVLDGVRCEIPGRKIDPIDTTGAGDAFMAAMIAELVRIGKPGTTEGWKEMLEFAASVSAATCLAKGGATAMPTHDEVASRLGSS